MRAVLVTVVAALWSCGGRLEESYPPKEPVWVDADKRPFAEAPEEYFSPFAWDAVNHSIFRPVSRFFAVDPAGKAKNVNSMDEVPDSSWFQNRIGLFGMSAEQVARGACKTPPLDPRRPWFVVSAKPDGANPGFIIRGPDRRRYLIKMDGQLQGPRATAADVIGSRIYYAAGYYAPCNRVVYFRRSIVRIDEEATAEDAEGNERPLTEDDLEGVFDDAVQLRDGRYRASSSLFFEGKPLGPWSYQGTRDDDPNDVVDHEDRRELRGMRLLAAWIGHFDSREKNTLATWIDAGGGRGYVRHNILDFGDSLGSLWEPPMMGRRLGHSYYLDFGYVLGDWITLGVIERPWDKARFGPSGPVFGYFDVELFDPEQWRTGYPNPAFIRMQERDAAWMARVIARFSDEHVRALIATADLRDELLDRELFRILSGRRDKILRRYLAKLSPLALPRLTPSEGTARLCVQDLLATSGIVSPQQRRYAYRAYVGSQLTPVDLSSVAADRPGETCTTVPPVDGASRRDPKMLLVDFYGQTRGKELEPPARMHLYHFGGNHYRIVGLQRPDDQEPPG